MLKTKVFAFLALVLPLLVIGGGCSSTQLVKQAEKHEQAAEVATDTATKIRNLLDKYPAGTIEDNELAEKLVGFLPDEWKSRFELLVTVGKDVRESAEILAGQLPDWAAEERARAQELRIKAAAADSKINNFGASITNLAQSAGGIVGIIGAVAGVWFKRKQNQAVAVTKDIVTGIKSSQQIQAAIDAGGGADLRKSYSPETMRVVKAILESH